MTIFLKGKVLDMKEYEINTQTLALIPIKENKTKIIEMNKEFMVYLPCKEIIDNSCKFFGSSLEGRVNGTKTLTGITHKAPIIIEESKKIIFFPTKSSRTTTCCWISYNNILKYEDILDGVLITFSCGKQIKLGISYTIIDNQVLRSTRLESVLTKRINEFI